MTRTDQEFKMSKRTCTFEECTDKHYSKGYCRLHYSRNAAGRDMNAPRPARYSGPDEALQTRVKQVGECLEWDGARIRSGYGVLRVGDQVKYTHRLAWERENGPIPDGMYIDHMCHNHACMNTDHLRIATPMQNTHNRKGAKPGSSSKYRGVGWYKQSSRWRVQVKVDGKTHSKYFLDELEAAQYAKELRAELMPYSQN